MNLCILRQIKQEQRYIENQKTSAIHLLLVTYIKMPLKSANVDLEYEKYKDLKREDVEHLQEWIQKQPHLPAMSDMEIIFFLQSCNYSTEITKTTIDNYFAIRALCPEIFGKRDRAVLDDILNSFIVAPLPQLTKEGHLIIFSSLKNSDPNKYVFADTVKYIDMVTKMWYYERGTTDGFIYLLDTEGFTFSHLTKIPITILKKFVVYLQEALPVQMKQIHYLNASPALEKFMKIVKPFMNKKLFDSIHVHSASTTSLYEYVPQEYLPKDYGGCCKSSQELRDDVIKMVKENLDFIEADDEKIADESKRLEKSDRIHDLFGVDGCFKKLDID